MQGKFGAYSHNNMLFGQIAHLQAENGQLRAQLQTKMYVMIYMICQYIIVNLVIGKTSMRCLRS
jgi:hypothetical protein